MDGHKVSMENNFPDNPGELVRLNKSITSLKTEVQNIKQLLEAPDPELRGILQKVDELLQKPVPEIKQQVNIVKQEVYHHLHKGWWIAAALFLLVNILAVAFYTKNAKQQEYLANDTKYRYLKLKKSNPLQRLLFLTDSLYQADPAGMRDSVIQQEETIKLRFELNQQAEEKEKEAKRLRDKATTY